MIPQDPMSARRSRDDIIDQRRNDARPTSAHSQLTRPLVSLLPLYYAQLRPLPTPLTHVNTLPFQPVAMQPFFSPSLTLKPCTLLPFLFLLSSFPLSILPSPTVYVHVYMCVSLLTGATHCQPRAFVRRACLRTRPT